MASRDDHEIPGDQIHRSLSSKFDRALPLFHDVKYALVVCDAESPWRSQFWPKVNATPQMNRLKKIGK
jgi:hypothetical protein